MPIKQARHSQDDSENQDKTHGRAKKRLAHKSQKMKGKRFLALTMVKTDTKITYIIYRKKIFKEKRFDLQTL